jgi:hypothetical protein
MPGAAELVQVSTELLAVVFVCSESRSAHIDAPTFVLGHDGEVLSGRWHEGYYEPGEARVKGRLRCIFLEP